MIYEIKMYSGNCDGCGSELLEGSDYSCLSDREHIEDEMDNRSWKSVDDKHYCQHCWEYDDNDNIIVNR